VSWMENLCLEMHSWDGEVWRYVRQAHICMCVCLYMYIMCVCVFDNKIAVCATAVVKEECKKYSS